jgi:hypothetical protein
MADLGDALRDMTARFIGPEGLGRYRTRRAEKLADMSQQPWSAFWRDLGVRFLVAAAIVGGVAITITLINLVVR